MGVLDYWMIIEVFLSVINKWKFGKVIVVISQWRWLILSRIENPEVCCAVACDSETSYSTKHRIAIQRDAVD
jgi:hypothetical protein